MIALLLVCVVEMVVMVERMIVMVYDGCEEEFESG